MHRPVATLGGSDKTTSGHTDIAAVLIAVLVVAIGPFGTPGAWDWMGSVIAVVVLFVLTAYSWSPFWRSSRFQRAALVLVFWAILTVGLAWPVQKYVLHVSPRSDGAWIEDFYRCGNTVAPQIRVENGCSEPALDATAEQAQATLDDARKSDGATLRAAGIAAVVVTIFGLGIVLGARRRSGRAPEEPGPKPSTPEPSAPELSAPAPEPPAPTPEPSTPEPSAPELSAPAGEAALGSGTITHSDERGRGAAAPPD
jgi:hypothetical protein